MTTTNREQEPCGDVMALAGKVAVMVEAENVSRHVAVSSLLTLAMAIVVEDFGEVVGAELIQSSIDEALAIWRHGRGPLH